MTLPYNGFPSNSNYNLPYDHARKKSLRTRLLPEG